MYPPLPEDFLAVVIQLDAELLSIASQQMAKGAQVLLVLEDDFSLVTTTHDMIGGLIGQQRPAWLPRHGSAPKGQRGNGAF
jgi:hypothetical protein